MNAGQPNPALSFKSLALSLESRVAEVEKGWSEGKLFPKHLWQTYTRIICDSLVLFLANCLHDSRSAHNTDFAELYDQFAAKFSEMTYACSRQNGFTYLARELLQSSSECVKGFSDPISNLVLGHHPHLLEVYTSRRLAPIANWIHRIFPQRQGQERDHTLNPVPVCMNTQPDNLQSLAPGSRFPIPRAPTGGTQFRRDSGNPVQQLEFQPAGSRQPLPRAPARTVESEDGFHRVRSRGREQSGIFNSTFRFDSAITHSFRGLRALVSENGSHLKDVITFFRNTLDPISASTAFPRELRSHYNDFLASLGICKHNSSSRLYFVDEDEKLLNRTIKCSWNFFGAWNHTLSGMMQPLSFPGLVIHRASIFRFLWSLEGKEQVRGPYFWLVRALTPRLGTRGGGTQRGQSLTEQAQQPQQHTQNIWTQQPHAAHQPHNERTHLDPTHFERSDLTPASGFTQTSGNQMRFSNTPSTSQARQPRISDILNLNDRPTPFQPAADFSSTSSEPESSRRTREPFPVIPVPIPVRASSPQGVPGQQHRGSPIRRAAEAAEHRHQQNIRAQGNRSRGATSDISCRGGNRNAILRHHVIPSTPVSVQHGHVHTQRRKPERFQNCTAAQNVADRDGSYEDERPPEVNIEDGLGHEPHLHWDGETCRQARRRPGLESGGREADGSGESVRLEEEDDDADRSGGGRGGNGGVFIPPNDDYIYYPPEPDLFPPVIDFSAQQLPTNFSMHPTNPSQLSFPAKIHPSLVHNPRGSTNPVGLRWDIIQDPYHASFRSRYGTILSVGLDDTALNVDPGRNVNVFPGRLPHKIWIEADPLYSSNPCLAWWMDPARWGPIIVQRQDKITLQDILQDVHDYFYTKLSFADFQACTGTQTGTEYSNMDRLVAARRQRGLRTELTSVVDAEDIYAFSNYRRSDVLGTYLTFHGMRVDVRRDGSWVLLMSLGPGGPQKYYD
ncbi:hypothetical protein PQX77_006391 [Marasmius sp. AFHP31]|nr:hypothetical protein PQX77_006391 [Marasmius sp. AFHP31]